MSDWAQWDHHTPPIPLGPLVWLYIAKWAQWDHHTPPIPLGPLVWLYIALKNFIIEHILSHFMNLSEMTQVELCALVDAHAAKNGPPVESYDQKNTYFGWTDDGKGVWCLPGSKANLDRLEDLWRMHPGLGQCEIMRLARAEFFADWRDSDRARSVKE
ncbi:hypothetical protein CONLIGDRAFT_686157 [Coniochaeta ligniaria NRRL 30616]|uniref:Uncharacterized protein n=1 Tax=Coniochaeta ligniaria NRRL 30616 TaxID=1408157 RepID=A0A1J7I908_9PEZI|nr:hypothetical protein CONLIGDRAFT_686157 [Coniochaeta ligniaria NRRL 30616]